jgi:hypothetical protein
MVIIFTVVYVVDTKFVSQFLLGYTTQLAHIIISVANLTLESRIKSRGVSLLGYSSSPHRIVGSITTYFLSPLGILDILESSLSGVLFHFFRPCSRLFSSYL